MSAPKPEPLARTREPQVLDWPDVMPRPAPRVVDLLGLHAEDREVLGLSAPRLRDLAPTLQGDGKDALADALQRGVALRPRR